MRRLMVFLSMVFIMVQALMNSPPGFSQNQDCQTGALIDAPETLYQDQLVQHLDYIIVPQRAVGQEEVPFIGPGELPGVGAEEPGLFSTRLIIKTFNFCQPGDHYSQLGYSMAY
jgi:hypothetical protein